MAYDIGDITELIHYHLVLGETTDAAADSNLAHLVRNIEQMSTRPLWRAVEWMACEGCGAWVDTDLIGPDGAGVADDGGFYCASCRWNGGSEGDLSSPQNPSDAPPSPLTRRAAGRVRQDSATMGWPAGRDRDVRRPW